MKINGGRYEIWDGFTLELPRSLHFEYGNIYKLVGGNGSGKTSFINRLLLPALRENWDERYLLVLQQQMFRQLYVIKAHAALSKYPVPIRTERDAVNYMLHDLEQAQAKAPRPVFAILDESPTPDKFISALRSRKEPFCAVFCSHNQIIISDLNYIGFEKAGTSGSMVHEINV